MDDTDIHDVQQGVRALCAWFETQDTPPPIALAIMASLSAAMLTMPPPGKSAKALQRSYFEMLEKSISIMEERERKQR